jgi:hypothetical protein
MRVSCIFVSSLLGLALLAKAGAQSFNININALTPDPSNSFSGAANQTGFWNGFNGVETGPRTVLGLNGLPTSVQYTVSGGTGGAVFINFAGNTDDYALLLNSFANIADAAQYHFGGLTPGVYRIFTYAVEPTSSTWDVQVTVPGSIQGVQHVMGPMPGNQFVEGVTHSIHDLTLTGTSFEVDVAGPWPHLHVNGFQVVKLPVPEAPPILLIGAFVTYLLIVHSKSRFRSETGPTG